MTSPHAPIELEGVEGAQYGLGHGVHRSTSGDTIVYHSGSNPGVVAYFLVSLNQKNGMVVVANSNNVIPILMETIQLWGKHYRIELPPLY